MHSFADLGITRAVLSRRVVLLGTACVAGSFAAYWLFKKNQKARTAQDGRGSDQNLESARMAQSLKFKDAGNELFKIGNFEGALEAFSNAIEACSDNEVMHMAICYQNRAATFDRLGKSQKSIEDCSRALLLNRSYLKAIVRRARAHKTLHQYQSAMDDYAYATSVDRQGVCDLNTEMQVVINCLSLQVHEVFKEGRGAIPVRDEAVLLWRSLSMCDPIVDDINSGEVFMDDYGRAIKAIRDRKYELVIPLLETELTSLEQPSDLLRDCAFISKMAVMKEDASRVPEYLERMDKIWTTMSEADKSNTKNKQYRAIYYLLKGAVDLEGLVESDFDAAIELDSTNVDVYMGASMLFSENLDFPLGIKFLNMILNVMPDHPLVKHMKANCELAIAVSEQDVCETMKCIQIVHQLLEDNPQANPIVYLITARLFYAAQNKELAKECFQKAAKALPDYSAPQYYLAMIDAEDMEESGEMLSALEGKMKHCLEVEAANPDALAVLAKLAVKREAFPEALCLYEEYLSRCPLRYNRAAVLPAVINYIQLKSLCNALNNLGTEPID